MAHIPKQKRRKWDAKSEETILVGFDEQSKAYRIYHPSKKRVFKSRDVVFINEAVPNETQPTAESSDPKQVRTYVSLEHEETVPETEATPERLGGSEDDSSDSESDFFSQVESSAGETSGR